MWGALAVGGLVLGGIAIGAAIFNELSSNEKARQRQARNDFEEYRSQVNSRISGYYAERNRQMAMAQENHREMLARLREQMRQEYREINQVYYNKIADAIRFRMDEQNHLLDEIQQATGLLKAQRKQQQSYLRQSSLDLYDRQLQLAQNKIKAYLIYLGQYEKHFRKTYEIADPEKPLPEPFDFLLPKDFPYQGQIVYQQPSVIRDGFTVQVEGLYYPIQMKVTDDEVVEAFQPDALLPLLVEGYDRENFCYKLSCAKGLFMYNALYQPGVGFEATVESLTPKQVNLDYFGLKLALHKPQLENPWKMPFVGSVVHVYPSKWSHSLSFVQVTQKYEESISLMQIQEIPLMIKEDDYPYFRDFVTMHQLDQSQDEWKVAPWEGEDKQEPFLKYIRLQLGGAVVLKAEIVHDESNGTISLLYRGIFANEHIITPEQIFLAIDASLRTCLVEEASEIPERDYLNMNHLYLLMLEEFRKQKDILEATEGILYYNRWLEAMEKLCFRKERGRAVTCRKGTFQLMYRERETGYYKWKADVYNAEEIRQFLGQLGELRHTSFFIERMDGARVPVEFSPQIDSLYAYGVSSEIEEFSEMKYVPVYLKSFSYADMKQREALQQFRMGKLTNAKLKSFLLNPAKAESAVQEVKLQHYFNPNIEANLNQAETVRRAFEERDVFLIQGPPGTGKTTVIQELIWQELHHYPNHRMLIVSQANVAVDNVLRGLLRKQSPLLQPNDIVRCGSEEKIAPELANLSFERLYEEHREKLQQLVPTEDNRKYAALWKEWMIGDHALKAEFGELILKGCRLVAATCVGLAQRKIGLDKLDFDLVIIDEAGKALPGEMLIPLLRAKKVVIIGDHRQLPPTVDPMLLNQHEVELEDREYAEKEMFETSMFEHLYEQTPDANKMMLSTQYRMPNLLGSLVSDLFYEQGLGNGEVTFEKQAMYFDRHLNWLDMSADRDYRETEDGSGIYNVREVEKVLQLVKSIAKQTDEYVRIAVITPYKEQKRRLVRAIKAWDSQLLGRRVAVDTIDAFQGDEAEIVLYCTTRARRKTNYFSQRNRLNVALSRAKNSILFIGSSKYFLSYGEEEPVSKIYRFVQEHGSVIKSASSS